MLLLHWSEVLMALVGTCAQANKAFAESFRRERAPRWAGEEGCHCRCAAAHQARTAASRPLWGPAGRGMTTSTRKGITMAQYTLASKCCSAMLCGPVSRSQHSLHRCTGLAECRRACRVRKASLCGSSCSSPYIALRDSRRRSQSQIHTAGLLIAGHEFCQ